MANFLQRIFGRKASNSITYTYPADIRQFLDRDYQKIGYEAGLKFPHADNRKYLIHSITTEFRLVLDDVGQRLDAQIVEQQQLSIQTEGISDVLQRQIQQRLAQLEKLRDTITSQLELSVDNEGWLVPALARLELGFLHGTLQYQKENQLLKGINTLLIGDDIPKLNKPINQK